MHDALPVRLVERTGRFNRGLERFGKRQRALGEPLGQRLAREELHDQKRGSALLAHVVHRADMGMIKLRDRAGLTVEALAKLGISRERVWENLDCDISIEPRVPGAIHLAHATDAEKRDNLVRAEASSGRKGHAGVASLRQRAIGRAG